MHRKFLRKAEQYTKQNQRQRIWRKIVRVMACVVVFCTVYAMILPAITMERLQCALEEHTHSESCYKKVETESAVVLACTYESLGVHVHGSACYDAEGLLVCGQADYLVHTHSDECMDETGTLVCKIPNVTTHEHTDDCYTVVETEPAETEPPETEPVHSHGDACYTTERGELICQIPETEGHTHDDACRTRGQLLCQLPEQEGHTHGEGCSETVLACELTVEPHNHSDSCYQQLVCELEEVEGHAHSEECNGKLLNCDLTEQAHVHTDVCYQTNSLCDLPETEGHVHSDSCYDSVLVCELVEEEAHSHTDSCYAQISTLICGLEEGVTTEEETEEPAASEIVEPELICEKEVIKLHSHDADACYETYLDEAGNSQKRLICTDLAVLEHKHEESCYVTAEVTAKDADTLTCTLAENHVHEDGCYDENGALICVETENHTHGNLCYGTWERICGKEEHIHAEGCYIAETTEESAVPTETEAVQLNSNQGVMLMAVLPEEYVDGGDVASSNLTWTLTKNDADEYTLRFDGEGDMPNYSTYENTPWKAASSGKTVHLKFGPNVTSIGNWACASMKIASFDWGGVTRIGSRAFQTASGTSVLSIPGTVKTIGEGAFWTFNNGNIGLTKLELGEGIETIEVNAFHNASLDYPGISVHIPSTVKNITGGAFRTANEITVDENNPYFISVDGILYSKDMTTLVDYPAYKVMEEYRIPGTVTYIKNGALTSNFLDKVYVPKSVAGTDRYAFNASNLKEIYFEDASALKSLNYYICSSSPQLRSVHFPEDTAFSLSCQPFLNTTYPSLESLKIPNGVTELQSLGSATTHFPALKSIIYDAQNAKITPTTTPFCDAMDYLLTVGSSVDVLPSRFATIAERAEQIVFEPNNSFEIKEGALSGTGAPLETLSGMFHVDGQGLLYAYDATAKTAQLVYCPPDKTVITVPSTITTENGEVCQVTAVRKDTLRMANKLQSIQFEVPAQITELDALAMANCPTLTSVNGKSTVEEATASFTGVTADKFGGSVFYNTGLTGAPGTGNFYKEMNGMQELDVTKEGATDMQIVLSSSGATLTWISAGEGASSGGYRLLTGDTLTINGVVGNIEASTDNVYRIYFRITGNDASLNISPGNDYTFGEIVASCRATNDPYTIYLEFTPLVGKTNSIFATGVYPSPNSPGGGLSVWAHILSTQEAAQTAGQVIEAQNGEIIQAYWTTEPDAFQLTKTAVKPETKLNIVSGDSHGAKPDGNLSWQINLSRATETTSAYGKDYVKSVDYVDILEFPEGINWHPDVVTDVKNGNTRYDGSALYAGDVKVVKLTSKSVTLRSPRLVWVEEQQTVAIQWGVANSGVNVEMNTNTIDLDIYPEAVSINMTLFNTKGENIQNTVKANVHYHYREDAVPTAQAEKPIGGGEGKIEIKKTSSHDFYDNVPLGEDVTYTIDVCNNGGLPYIKNDGAYSIVDSLPQKAYISPANMERMFAEEPSLVITIKNAVLAPWIKVKGAYGDDAWQNSGNTESSTETHTLTVTYADGDNLYTVSIQNGETYSASTAAEALKMAGYAVHYGDQYTCKWPQTTAEESFAVDPGEHILVYVYGTFKDTFRSLNIKDWPNEISKERSLTQNWAYLQRDNTNVKSVVTNNYLVREAILTKSVYKNGALLDRPSARHGEVLDYHLNFSHVGTGSYDNLPMVDDLYGSQYLLAPVIEANNHLSSCEIHTDTDGTQYYILKEGSYSNVTVGVDDEGNSLIAASVEVSSATDDVQVNLGDQKLTYSGVHTKIKWYFSHLDGGNYLMTVSYKALVDTTNANQTYTLGNVVWLNDDPGSRLYATLWGDGTILDFEKQIVVQKGDTPDEDVLTDYSQVRPGEAVTYRLALHNTNNYPYHLNGSEISDELPNNHSVFKWSKGNNVVLTDIKTSDSTITYSGLDKWYIDDSYLGLTNEGQQYILWPEVTSISFEKNSTLYLYVTLTYPDETGDNLWDQYAASVNGNTIQNSMYLYTFTSTVTHNLYETGHVLLQKGVYGMYYHKNGYGYIYYPSGTSRHYYSNKDSRDRTIAYYVTLYNGGGKRLYLNDLQDRLPAGFSYVYMMTDSDFSQTKQNGINQIVTLGGYDPFGAYPFTEIDPTGVLYRSATVYADPTETGVTFKFSSGTGDYAVSYDPERNQYYLNSGEAIVFAYTCDIGLSADTEDIATNVIAMPYTDYLNTGVRLIEKDKVSVSASDSDYFGGFNDGSRLIRTRQQVAQEYGFEGTEADWLVSDVTVQRGGIVPGVTKSTVSSTHLPSDTTTEYKNSVSPGENYLVNWEVKLHNSGTLSLTDYTFTDIMPKPYVFQGKVGFTIYDSWGTAMQDVTLFTISERTENDSQLTVTTNSDQTYSLKTDGTPVTMWSGGDSVQFVYALSITTDADGNEVLKLNCSSATMSIPEGGYVLMKLSSRNPTKKYENAVYTNRAQLVPNVQHFDYVEQGSLIRDENGDPYGAENASPVTVSFGYSTSSEKRVTEKVDPTNTAASTDTDDRSIVLNNKGSIFTYELNVGNDTDNPMTKLVLIDNLPHVEDSSPFKESVPRNSEFTVRLADNPNFCVTITPSDPTQPPVVLNPSEYTVQFSTDTAFGEPQSPDWCGENSGTTANWTNNSQGARSIRLIIRDDTGVKIPAKSSITFSFDAVADSDAAPGEIAWNSFGYHYGLKDVDFELEAMPLTVGVAIPEVPVIQKKLVDAAGDPVKARTASEFSFLVYQGAALEGNFESEDALLAALANENRAVKKVTVSVDAGHSTSNPVVLDMNGWQWVHGDEYTVVELPVSDRYSFLYFDGYGSSPYTFTYDEKSPQTIVCVNKLEEWSIRLNKTDIDGKPLSGAVFALYSPSAEDQMSSDLAAEWNAAVTTEVEGKTWYLKDVAETSEDGVLTWTELLEDSYYLLEIKAPDGYILPETGQILYQSDSTNGIRILPVINRPGYELPETGGTGTTSYTLGGLLILIAAVILLYIKTLKHRKEDMTSF